MQHQAKAVSYALLQEVALVWKDAIATSASHAFRETVAGDGDFYQMFVFAHFLVERAREALLWTWVVGRIGALDDAWGEHEATRAWIELGGGWEGDAAREITVESGLRGTLNADRVREHLRDSGVDGQFHTEYRFCGSINFSLGVGDQLTAGAGTQRPWTASRTTPSGGGATATGPGSSPRTRRGARTRRRRRRRRSGGRGCAPSSATSASASAAPTAARPPRARSSNTSRSSAPNAVTAVSAPPRRSRRGAHVLTTRACSLVITALVRASGPLGLSAVLPHPTRRTPHTDESADANVVPHLPLVDDWQSGRFALRDVMRFAPDSSIREWSMRLMQRYRYVIGACPPFPLSTAPQRSLVSPVADLACSLWHQAGHLRSSSGWRRCRRCG